MGYNMRLMLRSDFSYDLRAELIAQHPLRDRSASRLLCLDGASGKITDKRFAELVDILDSRDLLVFNDTRVIPARLFATKATGGKVELLIERILDDNSALAQVRASKIPRPGSSLTLESGTSVDVEYRAGEFHRLRFAEPVISCLETCGHIPLPPYIRRDDEANDRDRYQTVYARVPGAVAAPTAGLHFDRQLLEALSRKGIAQTFVTLHVGAGTFQPVRCNDLSRHRMHSEYAEVNAGSCEAITAAHERGGRVIAVGTTAVRSLESAARGGVLDSFKGETDLFILPGFGFRVVDAMITNFHLPESTLLMLVAAFAGRDQVLAAYEHAKDNGYRFFSYGDAMFVSACGVVQ